MKTIYWGGKVFIIEFHTSKLDHNFMNLSFNILSILIWAIPGLNLIEEIQIGNFTYKH